jgi:hypothetical protein
MKHDSTAPRNQKTNFESSAAEVIALRDVNRKILNSVAPFAGLTSASKKKSVIRRKIRLGIHLHGYLTFPKILPKTRAADVLDRFSISSV